MSNIKEDCPTNSAGPGHIDGIGVGDKREPGVKKKKKADVVLADMLKRKVMK